MEILAMDSFAEQEKSLVTADPFKNILCQRPFPEYILKFLVIYICGIRLKEHEIQITAANTFVLVFQDY